MRMDQFSKEEIKERNDFLYEHILSLSSPKTWLRSLEMTDRSIAAFENEAWLADIDTVYIVGHGTSLATSMNAESWFNHIAGVRAAAVPAFQFKSYPFDYLRNTRNMLVIGISSGGNTASVASAMKLARQAGAKTLCMSGADEDLAIAKEAEYRVIADTKSEKTGRFPAPAYSISHIYLLLAAFRVAVLLGARNGRLNSEDRDYWQKQLDGLLNTMQALPQLYEKTAAAADALMAGGMKNLAVLGVGPNLGTMKEGALKISEFCWMFGAGEELEDFAHGRFREVGSDEALLIIAPKGPAIAKAMDILAGCAISGTPAVVFTDEPNQAMRKMAEHIVEMPSLDDEYMTPFLYVFPMWFFGHRIRSEAGGLVGQPRHNLFASDINFTAHFDETGERKK